MKNTKDIFAIRKPALGIDISDSSLKIMLLKYSGGTLRVAGFKETAFPQGVIVKDEIKDPKILKEIILDSISKPEFGKLDTKLVIASLPESKCFVRTIGTDFPLDKENLKEELMYEAEQHIPLGINEVYTDFNIISSKPSQKILFTAAPKNTVDPMIEILVSAGLKPISMEIESFSLARSMLTEKDQKTPCLIIDIGTNRTGLAIFKENIPLFTSSLETAGKSITEAIQKTKNLLFSQAEKIKKSIDLTSDTQPETNLAVGDVIKTLANEIKGTINFFNEHFSEKGNDLKILLSGGGAKLKGIDNQLSKILNLPVLIGNPWVNVEKKQVEHIFKSSNEHSAGFATVIGLAIRGANNKNY